VAAAAPSWPPSRPAKPSGTRRDWPPGSSPSARRNASVLPASGQAPLTPRPVPPRPTGHLYLGGKRTSLLGFDRTVGWIPSPLYIERGLDACCCREGPARAVAPRDEFEPHRQPAPAPRHRLSPLLEGARTRPSLSTAEPTHANSSLLRSAAPSGRATRGASPGRSTAAAAAGRAFHPRFTSADVSYGDTFASRNPWSRSSWER
jgi:hypothetical protein